MHDDPTILAALLAAAILEEIVFRAGVQEMLLRWWLRRTARTPAARSMPNLLTAAIFAMAHALLRSWQVGTAALPAALVLGWLYERKRRVWPCIALHAAFNVAWFFAAPLIPAAWLAH